MKLILIFSSHLITSWIKRIWICPLIVIHLISWSLVPKSGCLSAALWHQQEEGRINVCAGTVVRPSRECWYSFCHDFFIFMQNTCSGDPKCCVCSIVQGNLMQSPGILCLFSPHLLQLEWKPSVLKPPEKQSWETLVETASVENPPSLIYERGRGNNSPEVWCKKAAISSANIPYPPLSPTGTAFLSKPP